MFLEALITVCFLVAAGLLVLAGVVKLRNPEPTARALRGVGLPGGHAPVRAFGVVEMGVGAAALLAPAVAAVPLAALYLAFAAFVGYVLYRGLPLSSCGCLGETETSPSGVHVAVTLVAAAAGVAAAVAAPPGVGALVAADPILALPLATGLGTALYLAYITLALVPDALSAYRGAVPDAEA